VKFDAVGCFHVRSLGEMVNGRPLMGLRKYPGAIAQIMDGCFSPRTTLTHRIPHARRSLAIGRCPPTDACGYMLGIGDFLLGYLSTVKYDHSHCACHFQTLKKLQQDADLDERMYRSIL